MSPEEAKARRHWGLRLYHERRSARALAAKHGRRFMVRILRDELLSDRPDLVHAELLAEALRELGASVPKEAKAA